MKPYHLPPIIVAMVTLLIGAPVLLTVALATFLYLYCRHHYCEDYAEDQKLLRQVRKDLRRSRLTRYP